MAISDKVDVFSVAMRSEFLTAYEAVPMPAEYKKYTLEVPSTARIERYPFMSPAPGMAEWEGHRRYAQTAPITYSIQNKTFDNAMEVLIEDIEDDQTGGYALKFAEMGEEAKIWPSIRTIEHLAAGKDRDCFDGTKFFANSHAVGSGDNLLAFDGAANDGKTFKLAALVCNKKLKPLIWQNRQPPDLENNSGTKEALEARKVKYWCDLRGEAGYGYWWDAVLVEITDTPDVTEMHKIFDQIAAALRGFSLPKALPTDKSRFPHEQAKFNATSLHLVASAGLETVLNQALNQTWVPQAIGAEIAPTTNRYIAWADYTITNLL